MKLNLDCIRDILLVVESKTTIDDCFEYDKSAPRSAYLVGYSHDEIIYHISYCHKANLIEDIMHNDEWTCCLIKDLTAEGHAFVANTRVVENWSATKRIISKIGGASLKVISATAEGITTAFMEKYLKDFSEKL